MSTPTGHWELRSTERVDYYQLVTHTDLLIAFLTRSGGLPRETSVDPERNHRLARHALGLSVIVTIKQVHSDTVLSADGNRFPDESTAGDALYTGRSGIGLGIRVADCLPVFLWSRNLRCVGIAHCGWRGTVTGLAGKLALTLGRRFSIDPADLTFALGPGICADCYAVGSEVTERIRAVCPDPDRLLRPAPDENGNPRYHLDLRAANRQMLTNIGLAEAASLDRCTFEQPDLFYSVRRNRTTGRNLAVIALRSGNTTNR